MPSRLAQYQGRTRLAGSSRRGFVRMGLMLGLLLIPLGMGAGPADPLFRLVPPESSVVLAVEDLRDGAKRVEAAAITEELKRLPLVATWLASDRVRRFQRIEEKLEVASECRSGPCATRSSAMRSCWPSCRVPTTWWTGPRGCS